MLGDNRLQSHVWGIPLHPPLLQTQCSDDGDRLSIETGALHSDTHDSDSERSSQAFFISSLETPWSSKVCSLRPWTLVHYLFHQRALLPTRNKVGVLYSMAPPNQRTDGTCQPRIGPVPLAICKWAARQLVWPLTHGRVPAQQSRLLHYLTASISTRH